MSSTGHNLQRAQTQHSTLVAVRLPTHMKDVLHAVVVQEDLTMSQVLRRALRHELTAMGYMGGQHA